MVPEPGFGEKHGVEFFSVAAKCHPPEERS